MESIFKEPSAKERETKAAYDALYARLKKEQAEVAAAAGTSQPQQSRTTVAGTSRPQVSRDDQLVGSSKRLQTPLILRPKKQRQSVVTPPSVDAAEEGEARKSGETVVGQHPSATDFPFPHLFDRNQPYEAKREMLLGLMNRFASSHPTERYYELDDTITSNLLVYDNQSFKLHRQINAFIYSLMLYDLESIKLRLTRYELKQPASPEFQPAQSYIFPSVIVHTSVFSKNIVFYAPLRGLYTYGVRNDSHVRANEVTKISRDVLPEQISRTCLSPCGTRISPNGRS